MASGNSSAAVRGVQQDTTAQLAELEKSADLVTQFYQNKQKEREAALKIADPEERQQKVALIDADIAKVREETKADTANIATVVAAVLVKEQELDANFDKLSAYNPEEKVEYDAREAEVTAAKQAVEDAKTGKGWFGGMFNSLSKAETALKAAEDSLAATKSKLDLQVRQRVLRADFQSSIATLQLSMERSVRASVKHRDVLKIELQAITVSKEASFKMAEQKAAEKMLLDKAIDALQRDLAAATERLPNITEKDKYIKAEQEMAELKRQVEEKTNSRNSALGVQMEQSKNATDFSNAEVAALQEVGTMQNLIDIMNVKVENLPKMRSHYITIIQGGAIVELSKNLLQVGDKGADTMSERIARAGQASVNARHEYYDGQPEELAKKVERRRAQEAAQIQNIKNDERIAKAFEAAGVDFNRIFTHREAPTDQPSA